MICGSGTTMREHYRGSARMAQARGRLGHGAGL